LRGPGVNEFLEQFLLESRELVEQGTADLLALEKAPGDAARLDSAFRAFHTLKGGAGIVEFAAMERAVHGAEDVLAEVRAGKRAITTQVVGDCLTCLDQVVQWLDGIERSGDLPRDADAGATAVVARFARAEAASEAGLSAAARALLEFQVALVDEPTSQGSTGRLASAVAVTTNVLRSTGRSPDADRVLRALESSLAAKDSNGLRAAIQEVLAGGSSMAAPALHAASETEPERKARTLRVDATRVDALVDLTAELTVAQNSIGHAATLIDEQLPELGDMLRTRHAVLHRLVGELQHAVRAMRVLPLDHVFQRFPRLVREMAAELGKPANLVIEGGDTEADKAIVENLFEPLVHVIRNAIDHGIENAATRVAFHKPAMATIRLAASRLGEHVVVEVRDDGQGIDVKRVRELALERGLVAEEALAAMSDEAAIDIIFEPGFSTAAKVTGLSGRGVGMDAVRAAVGRLAGQVRVESRPGQGTTVRFTLPFSVMMTPVMVVGAGGQAFGIPLDAVVETLRIGADRVSPIGTSHVVVIRDRTIPLVSLAKALDARQEERQEAEVTLVITSVEGHYGALRVDRVGERMEVMMKPLEGILAGIRGLAGSTLLGDGSVLLILDLGTLLE
jgi:two-component system chemotaxis sensor kinase CheA